MHDRETLVSGTGNCYFLRVARRRDIGALATGRVRLGVIVKELLVVAMRFNPPPGWPPPPEGFTPDPGWRPDPSWPPAPPGWQLWVPDETERSAGSGLTPGYIGYAQPVAPPGYSQWQGWGPPALPPSGTNGLAIAGFVLGLLGIVGISAILGIVLSSVALSSIRRTGQQGKGLAIAGIVLGSCWLAIGILLVIAAVVGTSSGSGSG